MSKGEGLKIGIKFTEDLVGDVSGNEEAFTISWQEYKYVNGPLLSKSYTPISIETHSSEPKSILLTMDWWEKFRNVEGDVTVAYNAIKGSLTGADGAVESFEVNFTPEDLIPVPNPNEEIIIKANPYEIKLDFNEINYKKGYANEYLKAYPYAITLNLINVDEINP